MNLKNAKIQSFRPTKDGGVVFALKFTIHDITEEEVQTVRALWIADQEVDIQMTPSVATNPQQ
jgi:hypothetical protein